MTEPEQTTASAARLLAPNPSPMTLDGTNTWVLREPGGTRLVIVDPGPLQNGHVDRLAALGPIDLIVLTHGHFDHAEAAPRLHELTGAPVAARDPALCIGAPPLADAARASAAGVEWLTVLTPGHSSDSVCLLLESDQALLTGDTVLGRGTTVVAHPDGRLADYLDSLQRLRDLARQEVSVVLPGHGPVVTDPVEVLTYYLVHRHERLDQVRAAVAAGDRDPKAVVRRVYADVDPVLWPAAELSVRAQLDYLAGDDR
ncbi:MAG TPA: MBL fold metallo-hydrolase [Mycobacteriales bacterium]|nr:MBL fold metallo-hydrolase [Mycobacteriales bacterium]